LEKIGIKVCSFNDGQGAYIEDPSFLFSVVRRLYERNYPGKKPLFRAVWDSSADNKSHLSLILAEEGQSQSRNSVFNIVLYDSNDAKENLEKYGVPYFSDLVTNISRNGHIKTPEGLWPVDFLANPDLHGLFAIYDRRKDHTFIKKIVVENDLHIFLEQQSQNGPKHSNSSQTKITQPQQNCQNRHITKIQGSESLSSKTVVQLKNILEQHSLSKSGLKQDLVNRLSAFYSKSKTNQECIQQVQIEIPEEKEKYIKDNFPQILSEILIKKFNLLNFELVDNFVEICPCCHCCKHQLKYSILNPFHHFWKGPRKYFANLFGILPEHIDGYCCLHCLQRLVEGALWRLMKGWIQARDWIIQFFCQQQSCNISETRLGISSKILCRPYSFKCKRYSKI